MDAIKNIKIEISRKKDDLEGKVRILCIDKEILYHDLDDTAIWIHVHILQNYVASIRRK